MTLLWPLLQLSPSTRHHTLANLLLFPKRSRHTSASGPLHLPASSGRGSLLTDIFSTCILISFRFLLKCNIGRPFLYEMPTPSSTFNIPFPSYISLFIGLFVHSLLPFPLPIFLSPLEYSFHGSRIFVCFVHENSPDVQRVSKQQLRFPHCPPCLRTPLFRYTVFPCTRSSWWYGSTVDVAKACSPWRAWRVPVKCQSLLLPLEKYEDLW